MRRRYPYEDPEAAILWLLEEVARVRAEVPKGRPQWKQTRQHLRELEKQCRVLFQMPHPITPGYSRRINSDII